MASPTLKQIKEANPTFFNEESLRFFNDSTYDLEGFLLSIEGTREGSDRRTHRWTHQYAIDPNTLELHSLAKDRGNGRLYYFCQPDPNGPVLVQYVNDNDGTPDGPPTPDRPNQHERR